MREETFTLSSAATSAPSWSRPPKAAPRCSRLAAAASSDHTFAIKFRLFAGGRWPLGIIGGRLLVF
jgi:hypothetical protein